MRRFRYSALVASLAVLPAAAVAQSQFEGVITMRMTTGQGPMDMAYSVKGDRFRMDMTGMGGMAVYTIHDASTNTNTMVLPARKMYMETSGAQGMASPEGKGKAPTIKMTGKTETIAGLQCEHMIVSSDDGVDYDVCAAKGLGTYFIGGNPMGMRGGRGAPPAAEAWQHLGTNTFPLKVQRVGGDVSMEVTKIEKKSLDDDLFKVPSDFQKFDMGGMGRGRPPRI